MTLEEIINWVKQQADFYNKQAIEDFRNCNYQDYTVSNDLFWRYGCAAKYLKERYKAFLQTEDGKLWEQTKTSLKESNDFGDYLCDSYPEILQ